MTDASVHDRALIDAGLAELCRSAPPGVSPRMWEAICYALAGGGKRLRGLLVLASYRACGGTADAVSLAVALEIVHAYSLIHDDLPCMDDGDVRRGRATVHRAFDVATATLAGMAMIPLAARTAHRGAVALGLSNEVGDRIVAELMAAAGASGMVAGQFMDLEAEHSAQTLGALEAMHRAKTGALIAAAARVGGVAAGASDRVVDALGAYGSDLGLAFQIVDDLLDVTATTEQLGKTVQRDRWLGKSTYPALLGIEGSRRRTSTVVESACRTLVGAGVLSDDLARLARLAIERQT